MSEFGEDDLRRHEREQETPEALEALAVRVLTDRVVELSAALGHVQAMGQVLRGMLLGREPQALLTQIDELCRSVLWTQASGGRDEGAGW